MCQIQSLQWGVHHACHSLDECIMKDIMSGLGVMHHACHLSIFEEVLHVCQPLEGCSMCLSLWRGAPYMSDFGGVLHIYVRLWRDAPCVSVFGGVFHVHVNLYKGAPYISGFTNVYHVCQIWRGAPCKIRS